MLKELLNNIPSILLYLAVFVVSAALVYFGLSFVSKKKKVLGILLVTVGLIIPPILAGLRYKVGVDYDGYMLMYDNVVNGKPMYFRSIEPASSAIIIGSAMLRSQFLMFFVFSLITICSFFLAYKNIFKKDYKKISLAFFITLCIQYSISLNAVRSSAAIAIVTLALSFILNKTSSKNIICCLGLIGVAFLFHKSALLSLIFVPAFIVCKNKNENHGGAIKIIVWSLYSLIAILLPLIVIAARKIIKLGDYDRYLVGIGKSFSIPIACAIIVAIVLLITIYVLYRSKKRAIDNQVKYLWNCALYYIPLTIAVGWISYVGGLSRIAFMLEPIVICLMASVINSAVIKEKVWKFLIPAAVATTVALLFVRNLSWAKVIPYQIYLNKETAKIVEQEESTITNIEGFEREDLDMPTNELEDFNYEAED